MRLMHASTPARPKWAALGCAVVALAAVGGCSDDARQLLAPEAADFRTQEQSAHTWRAGISGTWHGYVAPSVNAAVSGGEAEVCASWNDPYLFTRDGGAFSNTSFFSFDIDWRLEDDDPWARASARNAPGTQGACLVIDLGDEDEVSLRVTAMARHGTGRSSTTHHTQAWEGVASGDGGPSDDPDDIILDAHVIYFSDHSVGIDRVLEGLEILEAEELITLVVATSRADMVAAIGAAAPDDIVVYFNQNTFLSGSDITALTGWAGAGGRLIFSDWTRTTQVFTALGAAPSGNINGNTASFSDARLAIGVQQPMPLTNPGWGTFSTGLTPLAGAVSVCSFPAGDSCLVYGNAGRTVTVGFLNDTVTETDGRNFTRNLLRIVVEGSAFEAAAAPVATASFFSAGAAAPTALPPQNSLGGSH